jgi:hypothetical protein
LSIYGKLSFPYFIDNNKAFTLINSGKASSFFIATRGSYQVMSIQKQHKGFLEMLK